MRVVHLFSRRSLGRREQTVAMDVDEVDNTTHAPAACNLSAPALCAPTMGYYGGDVWRYPAAGNGSYYFMLPQRLWHWEGAAQGWHEPVSAATISRCHHLAFFSQDA